MIDSTPRGASTTTPRRTGSRTPSSPSRTHATLRVALSAALAVSLFAVLNAATVACAQSMPTAARVGDLQIGGDFVFAKSNFNFDPIHLLGGGAYIDFAKRPHWGGEFDFRHLRASSDPTIYERTYEIGPRIFVHRGRFVPYAKVLYGRGVYNFRNSVANVAYNLYTFGGGADFEVRPSINIRADYEYQTWMGFPIANLHPSVFTLGVAYHFHQ